MNSYSGQVSGFTRFLQVVDVIAIIISAVYALSYFSCHNPLICFLATAIVTYYIAKSTFFFNNVFYYSAALFAKIVIAAVLYYVVFCVLDSRMATDIGVSLFLFSRASSKRHDPFYREPEQNQSDSAFDFLTGYFCGKGW